MTPTIEKCECDAQWQSHEPAQGCPNVSWKGTIERCGCGKIAVYVLDTCAVEGGYWLEPIGDCPNIPLQVLCQECADHMYRDCDECGESLMNPDHDYNHEWILKEQLEYDQRQQQADYDLPKMEVKKQ